MEKQRSFFRVEVPYASCRVTLNGIGQRSLPPGQEEELTAAICNLSAGGILFACDRELDIRQGISGQVAFAVSGESFDLGLRLVRKVDTMQSYEYAGEFVGVSETDRSRLVRVLNQLEIARRLGAAARR